LTQSNRTDFAADHMVRLRGLKSPPYENQTNYDSALLMNKSLLPLQKYRILFLFHFTSLCFT